MSKFHKFTPDEDAPLLLSWHRGDLSAFENLVWKYLKRVYSLAFYLTGNDERATAATKGAFVSAFANISSFSSRLHFSNWLLALTLKEVRELLEYSDPDFSEAPTLQNNPLAHAAEQIRQLPPELAEVLVLHNVRDYPLERIAEICQLRSEVLISRLFAAHEILAAQTKKKVAPPGQSAAGSDEQRAPHPEMRRSFHAYLDSSLSIEEAQQTRKHLQSCGSCREALAELVWVIEHLKKLPDIDPPHWLTATILQRVKATPTKQLQLRRPPSAIQLQVGLGVLVTALLGLSAYLLLQQPDSSATPGTAMTTARKPDNPPVPALQRSKAGGFITALTAPFRNSDKPAAAPRAVVPSVPLPPATLPAAPAALPAAPAASTPVEAAAKSDPAARRGRVDKPPELPAEWGENSPTTRVPPKKAAPLRSRSNEIAVNIATDDPLAAVTEIENSVTSLGGRITGRAHSSGSDILYTSIDVDRFYDLMGRLRKSGRIQELPQLPESAAGTVELIIRWH